MPVLYASVPWHFRIDPGILRSFVSGLLWTFTDLSRDIWPRRRSTGAKMSRSEPQEQHLIQGGDVCC